MLVYPSVSVFSERGFWGRRPICIGPEGAQLYMYLEGIPQLTVSMPGSVITLSAWVLTHEHRARPRSAPRLDKRMSQAYLSPLPEQVSKNKCSGNGHK